MEAVIRDEAAKRKLAWDERIDDGFSGQRRVGVPGVLRGLESG